jgi:hypothetical protein
VIDYARIIVVQNSLTKFLKRVDSQSFFDISNVFPVGGESGSQAQVTTAQRKLKRCEGWRGSISELLVEENRNVQSAK